MNTILDIYKIGRGPSSSHTMAVKSIVLDFIKKHPNADRFVARAGGSLALTGLGHKTDFIMQQVFEESFKFTEQSGKVILDKTYQDIENPCPLEMTALYEGSQDVKVVYFSIGGGDFAKKGQEVPAVQFEYDSFAKLQSNLNKHIKDPSKLVSKEEFEHIKKAWQTMQFCIKQGLTKTGVLDGGLNYMRQAKDRYSKKDYLSAFAYAVAEENASAETDIVTCPTCGACGILPAILYYQKLYNQLDDSQIYRALIVAGLIAEIVKMVMPTSGAAYGCQAEVGVACAMSAGALAWISGGNIAQIEAAASIALEDCLGMTCDPVLGLVQVPCIDRNALKANSIMNYVNYAMFNMTNRVRHFDKTLLAMKETGRDMNERYRETSTGGLAEQYLKDEKEFFIENPYS
ncbi:MAG: L-serine ammonia-lyase, iron-sulfur-dependent, subunit alpha [Clostridiales bacterium]|nr:L-serine ammonia-lyase, iron-sulfur-dependent, subunit alpha [Clostridiales bacterium]